MDFERIKREKFRDNNSRVLRAVNALRSRYVKISDLEYGLGAEMSAAEISDCLREVIVPQTDTSLNKSGGLYVSVLQRIQSQKYGIYVY